jgi:hypothetical protein
VGALASVWGATLATGAPAQEERHGAETEQCFAAAEAAQPLMAARKLRAAQHQLLVCAREECPRAARSDCRGWLAEVTRALPTVVFVAREERVGHEPRAVDDVRVAADGEVVASHLDGSAVALDPGLHALRFEHAGFEAVELRVELREGQSRRAIEAVFRGPAQTVAAPSSATGEGATTVPTPLPLAPAPAAGDTPVPPLAYGLAGLGAVALGAGIYMEAIGLSDRSHLASGCRLDQSCAPSDVDAARNRVLAGDILVGAGALLFAGAAYVYFTRAPSSAAPSSGVRLRVGPVAGAVGVGLEGSL